MTFLRRYSALLAFLALAYAIIVLLLIPGSLFSSGVTFIDTDLYRSSGDEAYVRTKMDFGSQEHMSSFPMEIGEWQGIDYDSSAVKEQLGADVLLLRGYESPGIYQPIFFLIMQAKTESSFHPPHICYAAQGYNIEETTTEQLLINEASLSELASQMSMPLNRLVIHKESGGEITERRVVLFFYIRGNQFTTDTITMIRVEALAPIHGSYESILNVERGFLAEVVPYMFEPDESEEWNPLILRLIEFGIAGYLVIATLLLIPVAIFMAPRIRR